MNLANKLTVSRMGMTILVTVCLSVSFPYARLLALVLFVIAAITDYWDGKLAREKYGVTTFGQLMDPLADKMLVCAAFISLISPTVIPSMGIALIPAWVVIIIVAREFMVTGLRLLAADNGVIIPANKWGKHKTVWQMIAVITTLVGVAFFEDILPLLGRNSVGLAIENAMIMYLPMVARGLSVLAAAITLISGWVYFKESKDLVLRET